MERRGGQGKGKRLTLRHYDRVEPQPFNWSGSTVITARPRSSSFLGVYSFQLANCYGTKLKIVGTKLKRTRRLQSNPTLQTVLPPIYLFFRLNSYIKSSNKSYKCHMADRKTKFADQ